MKTDTSMNLMLVVFCLILVGFVMLNSKMSDSINRRHTELQNSAD